MKERMCVPDGMHPGRSCIQSPVHIVFSRTITKDEWKEWARRADDECWDNVLKTWPACCMIKVMKEVCPGIEVVKFEL